MNLINYGWNEYFTNEFNKIDKKDLLPARVVTKSRDFFSLVYEAGTITGKLSGKYLHNHRFDGTTPVVGDWVAIQIKDGCTEATIQEIVKRRTSFSRKPAVSGGRKIKNDIVVGGSTIEQVLAANIDTVLIVNGLDGNFNLSRLERYLTVAAASGAKPIIILNKVDLCDTPETYIDQVVKIAPNVPVHCISVVSGIGTEALLEYMKPGQTLAFLGSSGVGKSTTINFMFGEEKQLTKATSGSNGKGQHTTTCAELFMHQSGCMLIDTPGIRELKPWCDEKAVDESFEDIANLVALCKFNDCKHEKEPGCAINKALQNGSLSLKRYENYKKLHSEVKELEARKRQKESYTSNIHLKKKSMK